MRRRIPQHGVNTPEARREDEETGIENVSEAHMTGNCEVCGNQYDKV